MEEFMGMLSRLGGNLLLIILCAVFKWLPTLYLVFYGVGIVVLTISTTFMEGGEPIVRLILFIIAAGLLLVPSLILNIICIKDGEGNIVKCAFFALNVSVLFVSWYFTGAEDSVTDCLAEVISIYYTLLFALIFKFIFGVSTYALAILFLVVAIIVLIVMLIMRLVRGSVFDY